MHSDIYLEKAACTSLLMYIRQPSVQSYGFLLCATILLWAVTAMPLQIKDKTIFIINIGFKEGFLQVMVERGGCYLQYYPLAFTIPLVVKIRMQS